MDIKDLEQQLAPLVAKGSPMFWIDITTDHNSMLNAAAKKAGHTLQKHSVMQIKTNFDYSAMQAVQDNGGAVHNGSAWMIPWHDDVLDNDRVFATSKKNPGAKIYLTGEEVGRGTAINSTRIQWLLDGQIVTDLSAVEPLLQPAQVKNLYTTEHSNPYFCVWTGYINSIKASGKKNESLDEFDPDALYVMQDDREVEEPVVTEIDIEEADPIAQPIDIGDGDYSDFDDFDDEVDIIGY